MNSDLKYWYLHDHKLFRNLSFAEINALCILKRFKKSKKDEFIDLPFSDKERIYFLKQGTIKLLKINNDGDEFLLDIFPKVYLFGDLNFEKSNDDQEFFKVVSDEAIICTFYKEKLEEVMVNKLDFAINYIKFIGFSFKRIQNSYKNILFRDAKTRLLLLLNLIIEKEKVENKSYILPNYLTQKEIAQLICTSRQTIISLFKELEKDGLLYYTQKEISIPDIQKIKNIIKDVN